MSAQAQDGAYRGAEDIADIAYVRAHRHEDVGKAVGVVGALAQPAVELAEALDALFLVAEHLDDLLPLHHLLDVAVEGAEVFLLVGKVARGQPAYLRRGTQHDSDHDEREYGERHVEEHHAEESGDESDAGVYQLRYALAEQLAQGVDVVGVDGHYVAVGMGVEILYRQRLHVLKQLHPEVAHGALADGDH